MSSTSIPLNQVLAMSLDEYIQLNKGNWNLQRKQNLHATASTLGCNKRYINDDTELDIDDDEEEEVKNGESEALDGLDLEYSNGDVDMDVEEKHTVNNDGEMHFTSQNHNFDLRDKISKETPISNRLLAASQNYQKKVNASQKPSTSMKPNFDLRNRISKKIPNAGPLVTKMQNVNSFQCQNGQNFQQNQNNLNSPRRNRRNRKRRYYFNQNALKLSKTCENVHKNMFQRKNNNMNSNQNLMKNTVDTNKTMYITIDTKQNERKHIKKMDSNILPNNLTSAAISTLNDVGMGQNIYKTVETKPSIITPTPGSDIQSLLGLNSALVRQADFSIVATKLLDLFKSESAQTVHKPIYDMKMQKEIHDLQKKKLVYKTGAEVVSSDGSGINYLKVKPSTSGITLNCRFSQ